MKRREALKSIGASLGYAAIVPTALQVLQSCTTEAQKWTPQFLSKDDGVIVKNLVDLILPKTEASPGALEVNVPEFIDVLALKSYSVKKQEKLNEALAAISNQLTLNKEDGFNVTDLTPEDYDALLAKHLKSTPEQRSKFNKTEKVVSNGLKELRAKAVWAYKNSELVGETVLAYNPIPGGYKNCIPINEATNGKGWSLQR